MMAEMRDELSGRRNGQTGTRNCTVSGEISTTCCRAESLRLFLDSATGFRRPFNNQWTICHARHLMASHYGPRHPSCSLRQRAQPEVRHFSITDTPWSKQPNFRTTQATPDALGFNTRFPSATATIPPHLSPSVARATLWNVVSPGLLDQPLGTPVRALQRCQEFLC